MQLIICANLFYIYKDYYIFPSVPAMGAMKNLSKFI